MYKIVIFGNSGAGKSTLAKAFSQKYKLPHLDLDTLAWRDTDPPTRNLFQESEKIIQRFMLKNSQWVIEGCYSDLLEITTDQANQLYFINPGVKTSIENCKNRPWEPHKYPTKKAQDDNLDMLINWIMNYTTRSDEFSLTAHQKLYDYFKGEKSEVKSNIRLELI